MKYSRFLLYIMLCAVMLLCSCAAEEVPDYHDEERLEGTLLRSTVVYYATDDGYIVPVMRQIPWEEGIATATLQYLVATDANSEQLSQNGLRAVIPAGTEFSLRIKDGNATVNIQNMPRLENAEDEQILLETVTNTLCEFSTVDTVTIQLDGKKTTALPNGTTVHDCMSAFLLNPEEGEVSVSTSEKSSYVTLYFPNNTCALQVPISRKVEARSFDVAVSQMIEGSTLSSLKCAFPKGTTLISASINDDIATVNLSNDFMTVLTDSDGVAEALYKSIFLTAKQFGTVAQLVLQVDGVPLTLNSVPVSAPMYANEFDTQR